MKVLLFNGSPRAEGCTFTALTEIANVLNAEGVQTEIIHLGKNPVQDCIACGGCKNTGKCVFGDGVNEWIEKAKSADGFVFGTPVYYSHPTGRITSAMDRMFYAGKSAFIHKPAAVITSARRAGSAASMDVLTKHLGIAEMPVITSSYWNMVFGNTPEEVKKDLEGIQTMKNLAANMAWILKCIEAGKNAGITKPENVTTIRTNFIR
ncbi:MAG: flavodoxin family protein [Clostridia bacterium]|nr:flavodoxin family protein [Clostridia bacterium]